MFLEGPEEEQFKASSRLPASELAADQQEEC